MKYIRFFSTGEEEANLFNVWVVTEKNVVVTSNTLFSPKVGSSERLGVEIHLLQTCNPLTIAQCCGDWFNQKSGRLTGTNAGKVVTSQDLDVNQPDTLQEFFGKLQETWYKRSVSTDSMV